MPISAQQCLYLFMLTGKAVSSGSSFFYSTTIKVLKNNAYHKIRPKKGNSDKTLIVNAVVFNFFKSWTLKLSKLLLQTPHKPTQIKTIPIFRLKSSEEQKKVITSADVQFSTQSLVKSKKRRLRPQMSCFKGRTFF